MLADLMAGSVAHRHISLSTSQTALCLAGSLSSPSYYLSSFLPLFSSHPANEIAQALELHTSRYLSSQPPTRDQTPDKKNPSNARPPSHNKLNKRLHYILGALPLRRLRRSSFVTPSLDKHSQRTSPSPLPRSTSPITPHHTHPTPASLKSPKPANTLPFT